jgi:hypothetical protein
MVDTKSSDVFTPEEKRAMRERAKELKTAAGKADDAAAHEEAIARLPDDERELGERIRTIVVAAAPQLDPKTYYGFPAWRAMAGSSASSNRSRSSRCATRPSSSTPPRPWTRARCGRRRSRFTTT